VPTCLVHNCEISQRSLYFHLLSLLSCDQIPFDPHYHEVEFVSKFFKSLAYELEMKLHFTSGYYLEADGQTKCTNQILEQFLRIYYNYQQLD